MMGRTFWFMVGTGTGLYTSIRARRLAYRLTPAGVADQVAVLGVGLRAFTDEVRVGMVEREAQIADQLGIAVDGAERAAPPALAESVAPRPRALAASGPVRSP